MRSVPPSLEDVFIARLSGGRVLSCVAAYTVHSLAAADDLVGRSPRIAAQGPPTLRLTLEDALSQSGRGESSARRSACPRDRRASRRRRARGGGAPDGHRDRRVHAHEPRAPRSRCPRRVAFHCSSTRTCRTTTSTRLELRWPIYTGGRTDALERAARAEAEAVGAERQTAQADLRLEVTRAYWAVVTARASLDVLEQGVARSQAHVNDANQRFMAGLVPPNEVSSAAAQEARARMLAIEARTQRDVTIAELRPSDWRRARSAARANRRPRPRDSGRSRISPSMSAPLVESARAARQERRVLQQRVAAADAQRDAAAAGRLPTLQFLGGVDYARPNSKIFPRADVAQESWDVGVGASWSLWDGGRTDAEVAQARAASQAATRAARRIRFPTGRRSPAAGARSRIRCAPRSRPRGAESLRPPTRGASWTSVTGRASSRGIEVLDAEYALLQAQLDLTRAQAVGAAGRSAVGAGTRAMNAIEVRTSDAPVRQLRCRKRRVVRGPRGRDLRIPREQRRRQVHDDPHAVRTAATHIGVGHRSAASTSSAIRKASSGASATCRSASRSTRR